MVVDPSVYGGASGPVRFGIVLRQAFPVVIGVLVCVVCFGDVWCVGGMVFCGRVTYAGFMPLGAGGEALSSDVIVRRMRPGRYGAGLLSGASDGWTQVGLVASSVW